MLNRERKRAATAEERLAVERKHNDERLAAERQRLDALLAASHAEQIQNRAARQLMLDTIAQLTRTLTRLLERPPNAAASSPPPSPSPPQ